MLVFTFLSDLNDKTRCQFCFWSINTLGSESGYMYSFQQTSIIKFHVGVMLLYSCHHNSLKFIISYLSTCGFPLLSLITIIYARYLLTTLSVCMPRPAFQFQEGQEILFLLQNFQSSSWAHCTSCVISAGDAFPGVWWQAHEANYSLLSSADIKKKWSATCAHSISMSLGHV